MLGRCIVLESYREIQVRNTGSTGAEQLGMLLTVVPEARAECFEIIGYIFLAILIMNKDLEEKAWPLATLYLFPMRQD